MLIRSPEIAEHLFDQATRVSAGDSQWRGQTSDDYWAFIGPFGGVTSATMLRAILEHSQREGDPLSLTVHFCAPIARGAFDLDVRLIKANRSTQHWSVELTQQGGDVAAFATAALAARRPSWSHQPNQRPDATPFEQTRRYPKSHLGMSWVHQYDFRFVEGQPALDGAPQTTLASPFSKLWIADTAPRQIDVLSLMSMSDTLFGRIFHVRGELVPFGTVSLTTYFHADSEDLRSEEARQVLAIANASSFHKNYADQTGELWSPGGRLLATTHQIADFKA